MDLDVAWNRYSLEYLFNAYEYLVFLLGSYFLTRPKAMLDRLVTPTDARANELMP